ncbi:MAG TPA: helix-turn-helix domain-containing protein [Solirubrobacteraceae bacterium]|nr:helix-turn-helix domain-containing protein [Solirubrobacteraceae bacterium]
MEPSAPRTTPLTLVSGAIAGDDLDRVTTTVAAALGRPVAVAIPALGAPILRPARALSPELIDAIHVLATARVAGVRMPVPDGVREAVAVQIGDDIVGIVAAAGSEPAAEGGRPSPSAAELRAWLQAAAAAASINALIREAQGDARAHDSGALLLELATGRPSDLGGFLARARRAGVELGSGATALAARAPDPAAPAAPADPADPEGNPPLSPGVQLGLPEVAASLTREPGLLGVIPGPGRLLALIPTGYEPGPEAICARLTAAGLEVAVSAGRRDGAALTDALREAELLLALADDGVPPGGQDATHRLLIGVLLRDPEELVELRDQTISPLVEYDRRHDTDLLATLQAFLAHDGSTTETADAMDLHRHTVGYRLSRVHEVSGLSPYESDGRERLGLGLKAQQILEADARARATD